MDEEEEWFYEVEECSNYKVIEKIGVGTFGVVYKGRNLETDKIVAIKMITMNELGGVPCEIIREVSLLAEMNHENIVRLQAVLSGGKNVYLVFEYLGVDLKSFIDSPEINDLLLVKNFLQQILCGVAYCHSQKVLHRDLKPDNLLIDLISNIVKLADFGSAWAFEVPLSEFTVHVGTPWYEAPELLLASSQYSTSVDMWAVGCIFGEMVMRRPLFSCSRDWDQLMAMFHLLGMPTEETWPGVTSLCPILPHLTKMDLEAANALKMVSPEDLREKFSRLEPAGLDLLFRMLCLDPNKRISAYDALEHEYFKNV